MKFKYMLNEYEIKHNKFLRENGAECTVLLRSNGKFPLKEPGHIAAFGNGVRNTLKGGTGSGEVNSRNFINVEDALKKAGFTVVNDDGLESGRKTDSDFCPDSIIEKAATLTDTAVYILSKISGEGIDRKIKVGDILLTENEKNEILECQKKFDKFMLVLNVCGVVDLSDLSEVENILLLSQLGVETSEILADLLLGKTYPSGKLSVTWARPSDYPTINSFGNRDDVFYKEDIFVGYRYFDTADFKTKRANESPEINSKEQSKIFPFGFGLGFTEFKMENTEAEIKGETVSVRSEITNTGSFPGKEVLEVYVSKPDGNFPEPYQVLSSFVKTKELKSGEKEIVEADFKMSELASYDPGREAYVLSQGDYTVRAGNSSRNTKPVAVIRIPEEIQTLKVKNIFNNMEFKDLNLQEIFPEDYNKDSEISENENIPVLVLNNESINSRTISYDRKRQISETAKKLSDEDLINFNLGSYKSRFAPMDALKGADYKVAGIAGETYRKFDKEKNRRIPSITMADGPAGLRLAKDVMKDKKGVHKIGLPVPESMAESLPGILRAGLKLFEKKPGKDSEIFHQYCTAIPTGTALAQSFNVEFVEGCGSIVGTEMGIFGVDLWLAPGMNIIRDIRCGRNFEYYSEDPLLTGKIAAAITKGVQKHETKGVTIKHFAANNRERNRLHANSVVSERALREIYLKGFEICIKEATPKAVMTSYNLVNGVHTSENKELIENVLRDEFGHKGIVMTDWVVHGMPFEPGSKHKNAEVSKVLKAGGDLFMPGSYKDYKIVKRALKKGRISREELELHASRVIEMASEVMDTKP